MSQMNVSAQQNAQFEILQRLQQIIDDAETLIALEQEYKIALSEHPAEMIDQYVEKKRMLLDRLTTLFQGEQWKTAMALALQQSDRAVNREIIEKKTIVTERFQEAMLLHDKALTHIKEQYDTALTGLQDIQKNKQYLDTHQAMRQQNTRIDITQ